MASGSSSSGRAVGSGVGSTERALLNLEERIRDRERQLQEQQERLDEVSTQTREPSLVCE